MNTQTKGYILAIAVSLVIGVSFIANTIVQRGGVRPETGPPESGPGAGNGAVFN